MNKQCTAHRGATPGRSVPSIKPTMVVADKTQSEFSKLVDREIAKVKTKEQAIERMKSAGILDKRGHFMPQFRKPA